MAGRRWATGLGALLLAAMVSVPAAASGWGSGGRWRADASAALGMFGERPAGAFSDAGGMPRDRVIDMVQRRFNARVVRVNLVEAGGRRVYEMRLLSEQRVWNVRVDADTGQVLDGGN